MELAQVLADVLDHACPNGGVGEDGWASYYVETHCVAWNITARKTDSGWEIREAKGEDC